jgi:hypothetical protein
MLDKLANAGFEIRFQSHAAAILERDMPLALEDSEIIGSGSGDTRLFQSIKIISGVEIESDSHKVDHVGGNGHKVAVEKRLRRRDEHEGDPVH